MTAIADLASTAEMSAASAPVLLPIMTVPPAAVAAPHVLIATGKRGKEVAAADRFRGVLVHESAISVPPQTTSSKFLLFLTSQLALLARDVLRDFLSSNPLAREIPASKLTTDGILAYWAEERQRQVIDGPAISAWLTASATFAALNDKQKAAWLDRLPKLAAPSFRAVLNAEQAATVINRIADADLEHPAVMFLLTRLNSILEGGNLADAM